MKVNVPYKKNYFKAQDFNLKKRILLGGIMFMLLLCQLVYVIQVSVNSDQLQNMVQESNSMKIQNQVLENQIAQEQNLSRVQTLAENKYGMQPVGNVVYVNSGSVLSYNR